MTHRCPSVRRPARRSCTLRQPEASLPGYCQPAAFSILSICSQGGVEIPTGGMRHALRARERLPWEGSSRSGAMPEPTVTVRMEENARSYGPDRPAGSFVRDRLG
jgi:hypothetical protein